MLYIPNIIYYCRALYGFPPFAAAGSVHHFRCFPFENSQSSLKASFCAPHNKIYTINVCIVGLLISLTKQVSRGVALIRFSTIRIVVRSGEHRTQIFEFFWNCTTLTIRNSSVCLPSRRLRTSTRCSVFPSFVISNTPHTRNV